MEIGICPCCKNEVHNNDARYRCKDGYFENSFLDSMLRTLDYSLGFHNDNMTPAQAEMVKSVLENFRLIPIKDRLYVHKLCSNKLNLC